MWLVKGGLRFHGEVRSVEVQSVAAKFDATCRSTVKGLSIVYIYTCVNVLERYGNSGDRIFGLAD